MIEPRDVTLEVGQEALIRHHERFPTLIGKACVITDLGPNVRRYVATETSTKGVFVTIKHNPDFEYRVRVCDLLLAEVAA